MSKRKLSEKDILALLCRKENGEAVKKLAEELDVSVTRVYFLLRKAKALRQTEVKQLHNLQSLEKAIKLLSEITPQDNATLREFFYVRKADQAKWILENVLLTLQET